MYSKEIIERYQKVAIASITDACYKVFGRRAYMTPDIKNRINNKRIVGPAVTVLEGPSTSNVAPSYALDVIDGSNPGDVLVISMLGEDKDVAVLGGMMSAGCKAHEMAGCILDAGVRDVIEIKGDYDLPVFARFVSPGSTVGRFSAIAKDVPVIVGGVEVKPGDLIVADQDGVLVIPPEYVEDVLVMSEEIDVKEAEQTKIILSEKSLWAGINKYGRI